MYKTKKINLITYSQMVFVEMQLIFKKKATIISNINIINIIY